MKNRTFTLAILLPLLWSCASGTGNGNVVFEPADDVAALTDFIKSIEIIPLEKAPGSTVGSVFNAEVCLLGTDYIIADKLSSNIFRFSSDGRFICSLGPVGEPIFSSDECPIGDNLPDGISSLQVNGDEVIVVYDSDRIVRYSPDGGVRSEKTLDDLGFQSISVPEGVLTYYGYGTGRPYRAALLKDGGKETLLPDESKVIPMDAARPIFFPFDGSVYFTDTYGSDIFRYEGGSVSPFLSFDFGDTSLGEKYFQFDDAFAAAEYMLSKRFTLLQHYLRNGKYQIVETFTQDMDAVDVTYGICKGGKSDNGGKDGSAWRWFSLGAKDASPFCGSIRQMDDSALYCLLDPSLLSASLAGPTSTSVSSPSSGSSSTTFSSSGSSPTTISPSGSSAQDAALAALLPLISNPEALRAISPDANPIIAKLYLK